jgi:hypothetical protein
LPALLKIIVELLFLRWPGSPTSVRFLPFSEWGLIATRNSELVFASADGPTAVQHRVFFSINRTGIAAHEFAENFQDAVDWTRFTCCSVFWFEQKHEIWKTCFAATENWVGESIGKNRSVWQCQHAGMFFGC